MLKPRKAAGVDDILSEQIKQFRPKTKEWVLEMFNKVIRSKIIPKEWRKAHVCALLKSGKQPDETKNFRPMSLLCHLFKLFERLVLKRISQTIETKLVKKQAGFRGGKSCTGQVSNLHSI